MKNTRILFLTGLMAALTACSTALPNELPQIKNMRAENSQGRELTLSTELNDPDRDPLKCKVNWGDGTPSEDVTCSSLTGLVKTHPYAKIGSYQVTLEVSDGKDTVTQSLSVLVSDIRNPPTITEFKQKPNPDALKADVTFTVDDADVADSLSCTLNWGDGSASEDVTCAKAANVTKSHPYAQGGDYAVLLTVSDGKSVTSRTLGVKVSSVINYPPNISMLQVSVPDSILAPYAVRVQVNIAEQNANDTLTCRVNWGDNTGFKPVVPCPKNGDFVLDYNYDRPGDYAVLLEVDDGTNKVSKTLGVTIRGYMALTGSLDGTSRLWDSNNGNLFNIFNGHAYGVNAAVFSPDGKTVLTGGNDGKAKLWNTISGQLLNTYTFQETKNKRYPVLAVAFSPDGQKIALAGVGGRSEIRTTSSGSVLEDWQSDGVQTTDCTDDLATAFTRFTYNPEYPGNPEHPINYCPITNSIEFSPDGSKILTGGSDFQAKEWSSINVQNPTIYSGGGLLQYPTYSPDGNKVAAHGNFFIRNNIGADIYYDLIAIFNTSDKQFIGSVGETITGTYRDYLYGAPKFSPDSKRIAAPYNTRAIPGSTPPIPAFYGARIWNVSSGELLTTLGQHSNNVTRVAFNKQGTKLITGSLDNTAKIWDIASTNLLITLRGHTDGITAVMFSPVRY